MSKSKGIIAVFVVCVFASTVAIATQAREAKHSKSYSTQPVTDMAKNTNIQKEIVVGPLKLHSSTEAYLNIYNHNNIDDVLIAATSRAAEKIQLHKFLRKQMVQVSQIDIKKHSEFSLKAGGYHVMLIDLRRKLKPGMKVPITFIFKDGSWRKIKAKVE